MDYVLAPEDGEFDRFFLPAQSAALDTTMWLFESTQ
jgi:hypothetical protein